jgi:hypothetical protein
VLREGAFVRYLLAVTVSSVGNYAGLVALSFGVLGAGGPGDLGAVLLARELPIVVLVLVGGVYADRFPRRRVLAGTDLVQAAAQATAAVLIGRSAGVATIAACAAVSGAAAAFARPAGTGMVPQLVDPQRLQQANALVGLAPRVVGIGGAALGAGLVQLVGPGWALGVDAATFVVAAGLVLTVARGARPAVRPSSPLTDVAEGWHEVRSRTWLWVMILSFGPCQVCYFPALLVLGPEIAREHLGGAPGWAALVTGGLVGGILGGLVSARLRARRPLVVACLAALGLAAELAGLASVWPLPLLVVCSAAAGAGLAVSDTMWFTTLQRMVPDRALSRVSSVDALGSILLNPLGYSVVGPVAAALGTRPAVGAAAALLAVAALLPLAVPAVRGMRAAGPVAEPVGVGAT